MRFFIFILLGSIFLPGCAANMAYNGQNGPDLELVKQEVHLENVERRLGYPIRTQNLADGSQTRVYEIEANTKTACDSGI